MNLALGLVRHATWSFRSASRAMSSSGSHYPNPGASQPSLSLDYEYLGNPAHRDEIKANLRSRDMVLPANLDNLLDQLRGSPDVRENPTLLHILGTLPNQCHPEIRDYKKTCRVVKDRAWTPSHGPLEKDQLPYPMPFETLAEYHLALRNKCLSHFCGERAYYLKGCLADLEQALIQYTVDRLTKEFGFELVSVPDLLHPKILEACGMSVLEHRDQVSCFLIDWLLAYFDQQRKRT